MAAISLTGRELAVLALDLKILLPGLYLAAALLVGAVVIVVIRRRLRDRRSGPAEASGQLAHYRTLYEQGAISKEEFARLRGILGGELRRSMDLPTNPAQSGPPMAPEAGSETKEPPAEGPRPT